MGLVHKKRKDERKDERKDMNEKIACKAKNSVV